MLSRKFIDAHDAVFVVTAPGFVERQDHVRRELGDGRFEFVIRPDFGPATKDDLIGQGIYDEERAVQLHRQRASITLGHIMCSLAHVTAYQRIVETGIDRALIFEDDVVILPVSDDDVASAVDAIPDEAELIYWGWWGYTRSPWYAGMKKWLYRRQHSLGFHPYSHTMINNLYPSDHNEHFLRMGKAFCTHAYTVTRTAAERLLELNTPVVLNADHALINAVLSETIRGYASKKRFFWQRSLDENDPMASCT